MRSRKPKPQEPTATATVAFHEAGHALASVLAFRAIGSGRRAIKYVEISEGEMPAGQWSGSCHGPDIYSPAWPVARIAPQNRRKMEWQIVIDLAGPIAEAVARGERRKKYAGTFALFYCGSSEDFSHAGKVIADLCALTKRRQALRRFEQRALAVVLVRIELRRFGDGLEDRTRARQLRTVDVMLGVPQVGTDQRLRALRVGPLDRDEDAELRRLAVDRALREQVLDSGYPGNRLLFEEPAKPRLQRRLRDACGWREAESDIMRYIAFACNLYATHHRQFDDCVIEVLCIAR